MIFPTINPFGGLTEEENLQTLVPQFDLDEIQQLIQNPEPKIIEFYGRKGRGKTTHLRALHQRFPEQPIVFLNKQKKDFNFEEWDDPILFVDSIHYLNPIRRHSLYKTFSTILLTSHWCRKIEYKLAAKPSYHFRFGRKNFRDLEAIVEKRIKEICPQSAQVEIPRETLRQQFRKHGDNYRLTLNSLYDDFNKNNQL